MIQGMTAAELEKTAAKVRRLLRTLPGKDDDTRLAILFGGVCAAAGLKQRRSMAAFVRFVEKMTGKPSYLGLRHGEGRWTYHYSDGDVREVSLRRNDEQPVVH